MHLLIFAAEKGRIPIQISAEVSEAFQTMLFDQVNHLVQNHSHHTENDNGHQYHIKLEEAGGVTDRKVDAKRYWIEQWNYGKINK